MRKRSFGSPLEFFAAVAAVSALVLLPGMAEAQTGTVRGTVTEAISGRPLESAQVYIPDTGFGTLSRRDGSFLLVNVPVGQQTVRAEIVGFRGMAVTITVAAGQVAQAMIELNQIAIALDEIVVTGAGQATERRKLGNVIGTIDATALRDAAVSSFSEMISGREPGLVGLPSNGLTGEGARFRIRGSASMSQTNEPIIYIDGVRVDKAGGFGEGVGAGGAGSPSRLDDINPDAIERIEILKGAAAATLYGSEASNGVIQIFTKSGRSGAPRWTFKSEYGALTYNGDRFKPNAGFARDATQASTMAQLFNATGVQPYEVVEAPLVEDLLFETGKFTSQSLSVSGGSPSFTYFLNGRYQYEDGPFGGKQMCAVGCASDVNKKAQGALTIRILPTEKLSLRLSALYAEVDHNTPNTANNIFGVNSLAMFGQLPRASCPGGVAGYLLCDGPGNPAGSPSFATVAEVIQVETNQEVQHFTGSLQANYEFSPGLNADLTFGIDFVNQRSSEFKPFGYNIDGFIGDSPNGERFVDDRNAKQLTVDAKISWNRQINESFSSAFTTGGQGFIEEVNEAWGKGDIFPGPGLEVVGAANLLEIDESFSQIVNAGYFLQEQVGYNDWAFFTVGGRLDFNSAFGKTESGEFYPKASLSIIPSSWESWDNATISSLRFRGALGRSGLQPGAFDKFTTFQSLSSEFGPGIAPDNLGNSDLRPEVTTEWEVGGEIGLFNDRYGLEATYWNRTVKDALVQRQFPITGGFRETQLSNIGELKAQGFELFARGLLYASRNFTVDFFANTGYLDEEITDLGGSPDIKTGGSYTRYRSFIKEGAAPGAFFGAKLANVPAGSLPVDLNRDGVPDTEAELLARLSGPFSIGTVQSPTLMLADDDGDGDLLDHPLGKPVPDFQGAFGLNLEFLGSFSLHSLFEYKTGNFQVLNLTDAFRNANPGIGRNTRKAAEVESIMLNPASTAQQRLDALKIWVNELAALFPQSGLNTIEDADFVRFRELSLTYDVPSRFTDGLGVDGVSLTATGRNIALWTKYSGIDPESTVSGRDGEGNLRDDNFLIGTEGFSMPLPRRYTFAVRVNF